MGLQYRKRTKGKSGWFNFSYSDKNGFGMSTSVKIGGITHNFGGKRADRTTIDLGNGLKHVSYGPSKAKKQTRSPSSTNTSFSSGDSFNGILGGVAGILAAVAMFGSTLWQSVAGMILVVWVGITLYNRHIKKK